MTSKIGKLRLASRKSELPVRFSSSLAGTLNRIAAIGAWFHAGHASCARARRCGLV
jgi:hypothetical protein